MASDHGRIEELWVRYLEEQALTPGEEAELAEALSADPTLRRMLLKDERLNGLLQTLPRIQNDRDAFARMFADRLAKESGKSQFALRVEQRIRREVQGRRGARPRWLLGAVLAAAGILIGVLAIRMFSPAPPSTIANPQPQTQTQPQPVVPESGPMDAKLDYVRGMVEYVGQAGKGKPQVGDSLPSGLGLQTAKDGFAVLAFPDGTRIEIHAQTKMSEISETNGKLLVLTQGTATARVAPQPTGRPLILCTPQAEAKVLGTVLRIVSTETETRLDVFEGKVRLERTADKQAVEIASGHYAVAAPGVNLVSNPGERRNGAVLFVDFEDQDVQLWQVGSLSAEFQRPGNRFCIKASPEPVAEWGHDVHIYGRDNHLFQFSSKLEITFDYWAERGINKLFVQMGHLFAPRRNLSCEVSNLKNEQWTRLTIPITQLKCGPPKQFFCAEGDWIWKLNVGPTPSPAAPPRFYLDNLQVAPP